MGKRWKPCWLRRQLRFLGSASKKDLNECFKGGGWLLLVCSKHFLLVAYTIWILNVGKSEESAFERSLVGKTSFGSSDEGMPSLEWGVQDDTPSVLDWLICEVKDSVLICLGQKDDLQTTWAIGQAWKICWRDSVPVPQRGQAQASGSVEWIYFESWWENIDFDK